MIMQFERYTIKHVPFSSLFFVVGHSWRSSNRLYVPGGKPLLRTGGMIASRSVSGQAPSRPLHGGHTRKYINSSKLSSMCSPTSQAALGTIQLTLHATCQTPHGASRLVQAVSAWSVKTRRAPSRHCSGAKTYGSTSIAVHDVEYTPPPLPPMLGWRQMSTILMFRSSGDDCPQVV